MSNINNKLAKEVLGYSIIWFGSILIFLFFASSLLPRIIQGTPAIEPHSWTSFWKSFANWDGGHYLGIAQNGYVTKYQYAFFPIYPLIIKAIFLITGSYLFSALLISWLSLVLALVVLAKLLILDFRPTIIRRVIYYLLIFPSSIFFLTAYSESLFLFLTILAFYFFRKRQWLAASISVAFASATRPIGLILLAPLFFEYFAAAKFELARIKSNVLLLLIAPLGLLSYIWFLQKVEGNPFIFISAQAHWQRLPTFPIITLFSNYFDVATLKNLGTPFFAQQFLNLAAVLFAISVSVISFFRLPLSYFIFVSLVTILPLTTASTVSFTRLILPAFPIYLVLALWGENKMFNLFWSILSTMLTALISILFVSGYWIA